MNVERKSRKREHYDDGYRTNETNKYLVRLVKSLPIWINQCTHNVPTIFLKVTHDFNQDKKFLIFMNFTTFFFFLFYKNNNKKKKKLWQKQNKAFTVGYIILCLGWVDFPNSSIFILYPFVHIKIFIKCTLNRLYGFRHKLSHSM